MNNKIISLFQYKFGFFLNIIKREKNKYLNFDRKRLSCFDVNLAVIGKFNDCCQDIKELVGWNELPLEIKKLDTEELARNKGNCLDLLGVYIAPTNNDCANILLSKEKIYDVAVKYTIDKECMYNFVKIHECAHASMCGKLFYTSKELSCTSTINQNSASYVLIEESLATAIALKMMKNVPDYNKLEDFVLHQPLQYRYGLELLKNNENKIEELMQKWKFTKCYEGKISFQSFFDDKCSLETHFSLCMYELTNDVKYLSKEVQDIFIF